MPDYRNIPIDPAIYAVLTDMVYFSIEPAPGVLDTTRCTPERLEQLAARKAQYPQLRVTIAVGGWGRSTHFAAVSLDPALRTRFVNNLHEFVTEHNLDGTDFDWEFPADLKEQAAYAQLLIDVKAAFGEELLVTVAVAPEQDLGEAAYAALDRVHLMAYDRGDYHATMEFATAMVEQFKAQGVSPEKLCLGVPFYGRKISDRSVARSYAGIHEAFSPTADIDEAGGFYYNGPATIQAKTRFAQDAGLGGMMIWELAHDARGDDALLQAMGKAIR